MFCGANLEDRLNCKVLPDVCNWSSLWNQQPGEPIACPFLSSSYRWNLRHQWTSLHKVILWAWVDVRAKFSYCVDAHLWLLSLSLFIPPFMTNTGHGRLLWLCARRSNDPMINNLQNLVSFSSCKSSYGCLPHTDVFLMLMFSSYWFTWIPVSFH